MPVAILMTPFAEWLEGELRARSWSRSYLAATIDKRPQTIYTWFNDDTIPSPELCQALARVLHVAPELVLQKAGHLPPEAEVPEQPLPGWLIEVLEKLHPDDLRVVAATARGLLEVREEKGQYEAQAPTDPEAPPAP